MRRALAWLLAFLATLTAATMAASAAWDRGGTSLDRGLLVALSVAVVAGVHLIPALSRERLKWLLWVGCLLCTVYGHLTFFVHAGMRAGEARAQQSAQVTGTTRQIAAVQEALARISARPAAVVVTQLANTRARRQRAALRLELAEARRAEQLQDELVALEGKQTRAEVAGATDPVVARLSEVTGRSEASISLAVGLAFSLLLELLGAMLWMEALRAPIGSKRQHRKGSRRRKPHVPGTDTTPAPETTDQTPRKPGLLWA